MKETFNDGQTREAGFAMSDGWRYKFEGKMSLGKGKLKNLWSTRRRECLLAVVIFLLVGISLLINMRNISRKTTRVLKGTAELQKELLGKQEELQKAIDHEQELAFPLQKLAGNRHKFWISQNGNPQNELRRKIEQAAKSANIRLKSIREVQNIKITEGLNAYEISIATDCKINELIEFIAKIEREKPLVFWKTLRITPDNTRAPNFLMMTATLQIVVLNSPEIIERLWGENA